MTVTAAAQEIAQELYDSADPLAACRARFSEKRIEDAREGDVIVYKIGSVHVAGVHLGNEERCEEGIYKGVIWHGLGYVKPGRGYIEIRTDRWWQANRVACFDAGAVSEMAYASELMAAE